MELTGGVRQAIVGFDAEFNITEWGEDEEDMFGWTVEEAIGRPTYEITPGDGNRTQRIQALRDVGYWEGLVVITRKDGSPIAVASRTVAIRATDGPRTDEILGYESAFVAIPDVTDRLDELETEVERLRALLKRQMRTGDGLELESGVNDQLEPFVTLRWGEMAGQLTFEEAKNHANRMYELAHNAQTEAVVIRVLHELGMEDAAASEVLVAIRLERDTEEAER